MLRNPSRAMGLQDIPSFSVPIKGRSGAFIYPTSNMPAHIPEQPGFLELMTIANDICVTVVTISTVLRCLSRHQGSLGLINNDYNGFFVYMLPVAYAASYIGQYRHVAFMIIVRALIVNNLTMANFYVFGMACVKFSREWIPLPGLILHIYILTENTGGLLLYHRIFPGKQFRGMCLVVTAIAWSWLFFASVFTCYHIPKTQDSSILSNCIDREILTLSIGISNVLLDFLVLNIPMPHLLELRMSTRRRVFLLAVFTIGSIACIANGSRLLYATQAPMASYEAVGSDGQQVALRSLSWDSVWPKFLSGHEACTEIVACCGIPFQSLVEEYLDHPLLGKGERCPPSQRMEQGVRDS
ncbi:hypothetical protein F5B21DRAFT_321244 [Xylaria acuta]|nr:hypothetical protein F5B21DRAFT_321244 [Xylaria acuta]